MRLVNASDEMKASTPKKIDIVRRRSSIASHRASIGSGLPLPRPQSRIGGIRGANNQPSFDFITGETLARPPSRGESFRKSSREVPFADPDHESEAKRRRELEELRSEVKSLRYTIENNKQEEELTKLRQESELRDARRKAEEDFKLRQAAEAEKAKAVRQYDQLSKEVTQIRDASINEKSSLEKRLREFEETKRLLEEEIEEVKTEREESIRSIERKSAELETRNASLQQTVEELRDDSDRRSTLLHNVQQQLAEKDTAYGALEAEVLRLKAQTGDVETLSVIKRELSEQVTHIKKIETYNRKLIAELDHFKKVNKNIEIVEEEKRSLQRKVDGLESLQNELREAQMQRQRLEDERRNWTAYLQSQDGVDGEFEFDSPESLARALVEERLQRAVVVERLGAVEAELAGKDFVTQTLESEKAHLTAELEKAKSSAGVSDGGDAKARLRLERQKALAVKEVEFLRAQLSAMDDEDTTFHAENANEVKEKRIQELDSLVEQYRQEVETLHGELKTRETSQQPLASAGTKRPRDDMDDSERVGTLLRKNRKLQEKLDSLQASSKLLQTELSVAKENLAAASKQVQTRVLALRSNPTSDFEAIKMATLNALRQENSDLLAQLQNGTGSTVSKSVPMSTLEAAQRDLKDAQAALKSQEKHADRLRKVWGAKVNEFTETVVSLLGWNVVFMKNGKTKVTSEFYPAVGDVENSIEFDGDKGTMKVSGGAKSAFAERISEQLQFWLHGKGSIPCFLAALTIEFYDEANRDKTMQM